MKKLLFLAAMLFMVGSAQAQKKADSKTVYIVDGNVVTEQEFKAIPSGKIKNMNVMKGAKSVVVASTEDVKEEANEMIITGFSKEGKERILHMKSSEGGAETAMSAKIDNGKIVVTPQLPSADEVSTVVTTVSAKESENIKISLKNVKENVNKNPVILIIDSKGYQKAIKKEEFTEIKAADVESMSVCKKEDEALKKYGNQYGDLKDGVIVITLRKEFAQCGLPSNPFGAKMITVRGDNSVGESLLDESRVPALYLGDKNPTLLLTDANGKTSIVESFSNVKNDDIESFDVVKDEKKKAEYEKKYGPSKDGFVHIVLKKK